MPSQDQHRATYTVRPQGKAFVVVRELSGHDILPDEDWFISDPLPSAMQANDFAYRAAESFRDQHPAFLIEARPARVPANTGYAEVGSFVA